MASTMHAPEGPLLRVEGLVRTFPAGAGPRAGREPVRALAGVDLEVPPGGVSAVVGPNGAGKSTLFAVLLGFLRPSSGTVRVAGEPPRRYVRRNGVGYLPERISLPGAWRVGEALRALARLDGFGRATADLRAAEIEEQLGLGELRDRRIAALSRGALQRVGLAQALLGSRELLVLDEPAQGLDPIWRVRLRDLLRDLGGEGRTVLLSSHDLAEVERVARRVILLRDGIVREEFQPARPAETRAVRIRLAAPFAALPEAFPGARQETEANPLVWITAPSGPHELSQRLAALLAVGAVVAAVEPLGQRLEERLRDSLEDPAP